jgi:hypothetical protein
MIKSKEIFAAIEHIFPLIFFLRNFCYDRQITCESN